jgi:predicted DNA-binding transcriptional regulator AlpA
MSPRERAELAAVLRQAASAVADALARVEHEPRVEPSDRLLSAREASRRTGMSTRWLYLHAAELSFAVRTSGRAVRFSERGIERWKTLKQSQA